MIEFLQLPEERKRTFIAQAATETGMKEKAVEKDWWLTHYLFHSMPEVIWRKKLLSRPECPEFESLCPDFDRVLFNYGRISMRNAVQRAYHQLKLEEPGYEVFFCLSWFFVHIVTVLCAAVHSC
jgi:hypothetical protein